jgi:hypothetical protein
MSHRILSRIKMFQTKVVDKIEHIFYIQYPFLSKTSRCEVMCKNKVEPDRPQMTI